LIAALGYEGDHFIGLKTIKLSSIVGTERRLARATTKHQVRARPVCDDAHWPSPMINGRRSTRQRSRVSARACGVAHGAGVGLAVAGDPSASPTTGTIIPTPDRDVDVEQLTHAAAFVRAMLSSRPRVDVAT
jgi:hypothetical protein